MNEYVIYLKNKQVDTVFFSKSLSQSQVRETLIHQEGYHPNILVSKKRPK